MLACSNWCWGKKTSFNFGDLWPKHIFDAKNFLNSASLKHLWRDFLPNPIPSFFVSSRQEQKRLITGLCPLMSASHFRLEAACEGENLPRRNFCWNTVCLLFPTSLAEILFFVRVQFGEFFLVIWAIFLVTLAIFKLVCHYFW